MRTGAGRTEIGKFLRRFRRMGFLAAASFLANVGLTALLTEGCALAPELSFAVVLVAIFAANFALTRYWVFGDRAEEGNGGKQLWRCLLVSFSFRVFEWLAFALALEALGLNYIFSLVGILCLSFAIKSVIYDRLVFR